MKPFNNWNDVQATTDRPKLPMGGYICTILGAKLKTTRNGSEMLEVSFDITEGEYSNFYRDEYKTQNREDKYWKGVIRYFLPLEDGSEKDDYTKSKFKAFINAVEDSNPKYHWDWDENTLKGKFIGMITRNEEWEYNGKTGFTVKPFLLMSVDRINNHTYTLPADKLLNSSNVAVLPPNDTSGVDDEDLPF